MGTFRMRCVAVPSATPAIETTNGSDRWLCYRPGFGSGPFQGFNFFSGDSIWTDDPNYDYFTYNPPAHSAPNYTIPLTTATLRFTYDTTKIYLDGSSTGTPIGSLPAGFTITSATIHVEAGTQRLSSVSPNPSFYLSFAVGIESSGFSYNGSSDGFNTTTMRGKAASYIHPSPPSSMTTFASDGWGFKTVYPAAQYTPLPPLSTFLGVAWVDGTYVTGLNLSATPVRVASASPCISVSEQRVDLSWNDLNPGTGYDVYRDVGNVNNYAKIATTGAGVTTYSDRGSSVNIQNRPTWGSHRYRYRIKAAGGSDFLDTTYTEAITYPDRPCAVQGATNDAGTSAKKWITGGSALFNDGTDPCPTGPDDYNPLFGAISRGSASTEQVIPTYTLKRGTAQGGPYGTTIDSQSGTFQKVDPSINLRTPGTFYYVVVASNATGDSENSNELVVSSPCLYDDGTPVTIPPNPGCCDVHILPPYLSYYTISIVPTYRSILRGESTTYTITLTSILNFTGQVDLAVTGLGVGASPSFSNASPTVPAGGSINVTLTISTIYEAELGDFLLDVTGTKANIVRHAFAWLVVGTLDNPDDDIPLSGDGGEGEVPVGVDVGGVSEGRLIGLPRALHFCQCSGTMSVEEFITRTLRQLGDEEQKIWTRDEIRSYLERGLIEMSQDSRLLWDQSYLDNWPRGFNTTQEWERGYLTDDWFYGLSNTTMEDELRYNSDHRQGPGPASHTSPFEVPYHPDPDIPATYELPSAITEVERATWDYKELAMLGSRELREYDSRYQLTEGELFGLAWQNDGVRTVRKIRKPNEVSDTYVFEGTWGIARRVWDLGDHVVDGTWGVPRRIRSHHPIGRFPFGTLRNASSDTLNVRIDHWRLAKLDEFDLLPCQYINYLNEFVKWRALVRRGPGQNYKMAQLHKTKWERGLSRMVRRIKTGLRKERLRSMGGDGRIMGRMPPRPRLPWQYCKPIR